MPRSPSIALALAILGGVLTATVATAQPRTPPRFRPFNGVSADQFYQSSVARWADQLAHDLGVVKAELGASRLPPPTRGALIGHTDRTAAAAVGLATAARQSPDRGRMYAAFAGVEAAFGELNTLAVRTGNLGPAYARVVYDFQQLSVTITDGDKNPDRARRSVIRLAEGLDEQSDVLRSLADEKLGPRFTRELDQEIQQFARKAQKLHRDLNAKGDLALAGQALPSLGQTWGQVVTLIDRVPNVPPGVRGQAARVDALYRRLAERIAVVVPPPAPMPGVVVLPPPPMFRFSPSKAAVVAVAAGDGGGPRVEVYHDLRTRIPAFDFFAYDGGFRGGVRVSVADVDGDGVPDIITAPGKGMPPLIRVFSGQDLSLLAEFYGADPQWQGGVHIAASDLTADGRALIAVAPDVGGGPQVRIFDLVQGREVTSFFAFPQQLRGGARLAWADVNADGQPDLVVAPGPCDHGPLVRVYNIADKKILTEFLAFAPTWKGGVWLASDRGIHILCGADAGGPPEVRVFKPTVQPQPAADWVAFPPLYRGGVRVAYADIDGDGLWDFICAPGGGLRDCPIRVFSGKDAREILSLPAFPGFEGGAFVGGR